MKYMGSKNRIAKHILPIMLAEADKQGITTWVEPFVGGGNMIDKVPERFTRIGYDLNEHTIAAMLGVRDFVDQFPESITEDQYKKIKGTDIHPINSWIRIACAYAGIFDSKLAADSTGLRNYAMEAKRNALKQSPKIQSVEFICANYKDVKVTNSLIYCDPPYQGTAGYKTGVFQHEEFFQWCRDMKSKGNTVFVSEYSAPEDFEPVWQGEIKTNFSSTRTEATHNAIEKLFKVKQEGTVEVLMIPNI